MSDPNKPQTDIDVNVGQPDQNQDPDAGGANEPDRDDTGDEGTGSGDAADSTQRGGR